jgi:hypothetical protein
VSFFDDGDDATEEEPRRRTRPTSGARPRGGPSGARPAPRSGGGSARRSADPAVERRRLGALAVLVVAVVLVILLISSCQARDTRNSLEDYSNSVSSVITQSDATGKTVFSDLSSGKGVQSIATALLVPLAHARDELAGARNLSVPDQMSAAQRNLVLALQMRVDGINLITSNITQIGMGTSATRTALADMARGTARFYASDVLYKGYTAPEIAEALHGDSIPVGAGTTGPHINPGQFLPELGWLQTTFIATKLGAPAAVAAVSHRNIARPDSGDELVATAVGATTLSTAGANTVAGSPAPTFTMSVLNSGKYDEFGVTCTVTLSGGPSGKAVIMETTPGNTSTCTVKLSSSVPPATYTVTATVGAVPGETDTANNTMTYTVEFQ